MCREKVLQVCSRILLVPCFHPQCFRKAGRLTRYGCFRLDLLYWILPWVYFLFLLFPLAFHRSSWLNATHLSRTTNRPESTRCWDKHHRCIFAHNLIPSSSHCPHLQVLPDNLSIYLSFSFPYYLTLTDSRSTWNLKIRDSLDPKPYSALGVCILHLSFRYLYFRF